MFCYAYNFKVTSCFSKMEDWSYVNFINERQSITIIINIF